MESLKEYLENFLTYPKLSSSLFFQMKDDTIVKANMDNLKALPHLTQNYSNTITSQIINDTSLNQIINISTADARKNALYKYDLQNFPEKLKIINELIDEDKCQQFIFTENSFKNIYAYLIILYGEKDKILLYRKIFPISIYKKAMIMFWNNNRFDFVDKDMLKLDNSFDFIKINNFWYILNLKILEQNMGYDEIIKKEVQHVIKKIKDINLIDGYSKFDEYCNEIPFAKKILRASISPALNIEPRSIIEFTKTYSSLKGKFKYSNDKITITSKEKMKLFIKLLNDDLLTSELTQKHYESLAKDLSE